LTAEHLSQSHLYAILDLGYVEPQRATGVAEKLIAGGVDLLQLRAKGYPAAEVEKLGEELRAVTARGGVPLVINDHAEVARKLGAEAVHLGQDDMSIADARAIVGPDCAVGKSTHSLDQAIRAFYEGADYIGFGPLFATPTKPDYPPIGLAEIEKVHDAVRIPIFCIGGIKLDNLPKVIEAGAQRVVIVSGLLQATDISATTRAAKDLLNRKSNPPQADENLE
jgi:thiamine-phosphate pyrophosphorylase